MSEEVSKLFRVTFNENGFPTGFYPSEFWPDGYPETAVEVSQEQYDELVSNQGHRQFVGGEVVVFEPPVIAPIAVIFAVDLWSRMTNAEADQVGAAMAEQPFRIRKIFETANSYRSDHELWPLLVQIATTLFGEERAAQILAPSIQQ
ncbi:hypothetical protein G6M84_10410 [Agrobacterium tumefaciens]|uniref:hypothetical protein n=1 Tax=Agrobacterium tumefaciens TaxID=358 RepID=UPI0015746368|nr:hypothetical protein [Agrobacterium tumefaciens]NTB96929.1 hypothetical protein [Agrobacterium tumefaciens]NTC44157.1 hypothetical protein [Agrobacterium tumefaciens]